MNKKQKAKSKKQNSGFSLFEMLIVISVFIVLALISSQALFAILRGTTKTDISRDVRQNADYALSVISRNLRSAGQVVCADSTSVSYLDVAGNAGSFVCATDYVASGSARLTSDRVKVENCSFTCVANESDVVVAVEVKFNAREAKGSGITETTRFSVSSRVNLRNQ